MRYIGDNEVPGGSSGDPRPVLRELIHQAEVVRRLRARGYRYVHFNTMYWATDDAPLADVTFSREGFLDREFSSVFLQTTLPRHFLVDLSPAWHERISTRSSSSRRFRGSTANVHLRPHADPASAVRLRRRGEYAPARRDPNRRVEQPSAFIGQLRYMNSKLEELVDALLVGSDSEPIILLRGDHGPAQRLVRIDDDVATVYWERMGILNAYLVPTEIRGGLYAGISPVNTFRVIMTVLFGEELSLLPDRAYFSWSAEIDSLAVAGDHRALRDVTDLVLAR